MFTIDDVEWDVPCTIKRAAEIKASDLSGIMLDKTYFNDTLGTYMQYDVTLAIPINMLSEYTALYEILTEPVPGHTCRLPYNDSSVEIIAKVDVVEDEWVKMPDGNHWRRTQFTLTALHPTKLMTLGEILALGFDPIPSVYAREGDIYEFTSQGWVYRDYVDADTRYY